MIRHARTIILCLVLLSVSVCLSSDAFAAEPRRITLEEAWALAIGSNEDVRIAAEGMRQSGFSIAKATSKILPTVTAEGSYTMYTEEKSSGSFVTQPENASKLELKVTQPLYSGGKEWAYRRQAKYGYESSREGFELAKDGVALSTAKSYYSILKALRDFEIKKAALKRADERKKVASARFAVGDVTKSAVLRAEAESAGAEAELIKAKENLRDSKDSLKRLIGVDGDFEVVEPSARSYGAGSLDEYIAKAVEGRRDLRQAALSERSATEGIKYARGSFYPSLKLDGSYAVREQDPETTFFQADSASATVTLTFPIFEGFLRKAELDEASSKLREAELEKLSLRRDIEVEVRDAYNNLEYFKAVIKSLEKRLSFAEEDYAMVFEQFKYGLATTVDVIDADANLISAQSSLSNARYDSELAILNLKYAIGALFEETSKAVKQNVQP
ncbi:MAG: TolC family protein [Deltaproteobacteria bacterium]|nr:TolC family protein [Deltaproteobacteria bacterium]